MKLKTRKDLRGKPLDKDCQDTKLTTETRYTNNNQKYEQIYCFGIYDGSTEEPIKKCVECKAFVDNI